jgi:hypothetical protein
MCPETIGSATGAIDPASGFFNTNNSIKEDYLVIIVGYFHQYAFLFNGGNISLYYKTNNTYH